MRKYALTWVTNAPKARRSLIIEENGFEQKSGGPATTLRDSNERVLKEEDEEEVEMKEARG
jgi:hypothetical protein